MLWLWSLWLATTPARLDYRCERMNVITKPNRILCFDQVILRRSDMLMCCDRFEGFANKEWSEWDQFTCEGHVRAVRGIETMWSKHAVFVVKTQDVTLTQTPLLRRGKSILEGDKILVNVESNRAQVSRPRGTFIRTTETTPTISLEGELPATCPIEADPRHHD